MQSENPYAASDATITPETFSDQPVASSNRRFLNYVIDHLALYVLLIILGAAIGIIFEDRGIAWLEQAPDILIGILASLIYYTFFESIFGWTPGKLITGTRVVSISGSKMTLGQALGRSLCRFLPFEAFSFLVKHPIGWHDTIPKTKVVSIR